MAKYVQEVMAKVEHGDMSEQYHLGSKYWKRDHDLGLPPDGAEAFKWWRKAAERGLRPSYGCFPSSLSPLF
jgi:TPR repeat protein